MVKHAIIYSVFAALMFCAWPQGKEGIHVGQALAESSGETTAESSPEFEYFQMNPLVLPIITERGLTQQVSMVVSLELPYGTKASIQSYEPRLADAYLQDLYGALGTGAAMMKGNVVDVQAVKERLTSVTEKVLGPEKVHSVLLQVVHQRPM